MKKEEALKILGKTKKGRMFIELYRKGDLLLGKLKDLASKFDMFSSKGIKKGLEQQGEYIDKSGKVRPLATKGFPIKKPKGKNGGNGSSKPKKKSKTFTSRERGKLSTAEIVAGTGGVALTAPWAISKAINTGGLGSQITKDAKKREAYAKAKTKSKKYKSKSHMYPPPKPKRPKKSKGHMYPPPKRKKRSGV